MPSCALLKVGLEWWSVIGNLGQLGLLLICPYMTLFSQINS